MKDNKYKFLVKCNEWAAITALGTMTLLVLVSVVLRYLFSITFRWSDELTRFIFIYLVFLAIPIAFRNKSHARIEFFVSFFPLGLQKWLDKIIDLAIAVCVIVISFSSVIIISGQLGRTPSPGLNLPRGYIYVIVPIGFALLLIEIFRRLIQRNKG